MIQRLRSRHFVLVAALAVLLPVGFVAGLGVRGGMPINEGASPGRAVVQPGRDIWESTDLWRDLPITTRREAGGPVPGGNAIVLEIREDLRRPDLLLYWSLAGGGDALPEDAFLLGTVGGVGVHRFDVPDGRRDEGELLLYSLAHQEIVGRASFADIGGAR